MSDVVTAIAKLFPLTPADEAKLRSLNTYPGVISSACVVTWDDEAQMNITQVKHKDVRFYPRGCVGYGAWHARLVAKEDSYVHSFLHLFGMPGKGLYLELETHQDFIGLTGERARLMKEDVFLIIPESSLVAKSHRKTS